MTESNSSVIFFLTRIVACLGLSAGTIVLTLIGLGVMIATEGLFYDLGILLGMVWAHIEYTHLIYRHRYGIYKGVFRALATTEIIIRWIFRFCVDQHILVVQWDDEEDEIVLPSLFEMFCEHDDEVFITIRTIQYQIRFKKD